MLHGQRSCVDAGGIEGNVEKSDPGGRFSVAAKGKTGLFPEKHQPAATDEHTSHTATASAATPDNTAKTSGKKSEQETIFPAHCESPFSDR